MGTSGEPVTQIFGVRLHDLPFAESLRSVCEGFLDEDRAFRIFPLNPEVLLRARGDGSYADVLNTADLALPDGAGVAIVESVRTRRRVRRWPGVDIGATLVRLAAERDVTVVLVGGAPEVAERAAELWRARLPALRIEVVGSGVAIGDDGRSPTADRDIDLIERLRTIAPAIVLVGLGSPKQERWIARNANAVPSARIMMGVGGTFDMWAGTLHRAPRLLRRLGLEWAWRLVLEPHRLPRILRAIAVFPFRALTDRAA